MGELHRIYEQQRTIDPQKDGDLWNRLKNEMVKVSETVPNPKGVERIR